MSENRVATRSGFRAGLLIGGVIGALSAGAIYRRELMSMMAGIRPHDREHLDVARPVLIINRWSGGGKAERYGLAEAAADYGIEPVMLERSDDLTQLAQDAMARGADAIGMAGGDGSLGLVAGVAAAHGVPFFCVPVGTRNHFALDLGLDRDDPLTALEAVRGGAVISIDHGLIGDRLFLNNVSLGLYPEAVKRDGYRDSKVATFLGAASDAAADPAKAPDLRFSTPDGATHSTSPMLMMSNNPYVLSGPPDFGRRIRLDSGRLGVMAVIPQEGSAGLGTLAAAPTAEWTTTALRVESERDLIDVGVDGESIPMAPPLEIGIRPRALKVLVPEGTRPGYRPTLRRRRPILDHLVDLAGEPDT